MGYLRLIYMQQSILNQGKLFAYVGIRGQRAGSYLV